MWHCRLFVSVYFIAFYPVYKDSISLVSHQSLLTPNLLVVPQLDPQVSTTPWLLLPPLGATGIKILQSAPHTPQQNGRAERFMRTMMDKAEAMRHTACIPPSWWNFAIEHAVHVYNRTPMRRLQWRTPFEALTGEKPRVDRLRVFGCGAYVHIPADTRQNKLDPKSEMMTYLGNFDHGWIFMRSPKNVVFKSAQAEFDEDFLPKCPDQKKRPERSQQPAPPDNGDDHSDHGSDRFGDDFNPGDDDSSHRGRRPHRNPSPKGAGRRPDEAPAAPHRRSPTPPRRTPPRSREQGPNPEVLRSPSKDPEAPRRSLRQRNIPTRPGNVYGDSRRPTDIQRQGLREWKRTVNEPAPIPRQQPGPSSSRRPFTPERPQVSLPDPPSPLHESDYDVPNYPATGSETERSVVRSSSAGAFEGACS